jgi:hypothetical protein
LPCGPKLRLSDARQFFLEMKEQSMTVWIYVDTRKDVGDKDHLRVFATADAAEAWFADRVPGDQRGAGLAVWAI